MRFDVMVGLANMDGIATQVRDLLGEAAETHHRVYRIVDGNDPDCRVKKFSPLLAVQVEFEVTESANASRR
jgi:hypothetical protein